MALPSNYIEKSRTASNKPTAATEMKRREVREKLGCQRQRHTNRLQEAFIPTCVTSLPGIKWWRNAAATTALTAALVTQNPIHALSRTQSILPPIDKEHEVVAEAWQLIDEYYYDPSHRDINWKSELEYLLSTPLSNKTTAYKALRKSVSKLKDRYTRILDPSQMTAMRKFDVSGVGLLLTTDASGSLVVATEPPANTSASIAGVKRGDSVIAVDGKDVTALGAFEVAEMMQGPEGSTMKIRFRDRGEVALIRHFESSEAAVSRVAVMDRADGRMGYIHLREFRATGRAEVSAALQQLMSERAEWIVMDLRGNGGGVFEGALEIAGLFEGEGLPVAKVTGRSTGVLQEVYKSHLVAGEKVRDIDLAILLNGQSASSSEVLAGGLRDECKAALFGERSYGKGKIQGVFGLSDGGAAIVTVAEYSTPRGAKIDGIGLSPDLPLQYNGLSNILKLVGIERMDEKSITFTRGDVRRVLNSCRAGYTEGS